MKKIPTAPLSHLLTFGLLLFTACAPTPPAPVIPAPLTNTVTLPERVWSTGITINLPHPPSVELEAQLKPVAIKLDAQRWAIARPDRDNKPQRAALTAALKAGATLTQYIP